MTDETGNSLTRRAAYEARARVRELEAELAEAHSTASGLDDVVNALREENARLRAQKQSLSVALRRLHDLDWKDALRAFGPKEYAAFADAMVGAARALEETDD